MASWGRGIAERATIDRERGQFLLPINPPPADLTSNKRSHNPTRGKEMVKPYSHVFHFTSKLVNIISAAEMVKALSKGG